MVISILLHSADSRGLSGSHILKKPNLLLSGGALLRQQLFLARKSPAIAGKLSIFPNDPMARHHNGHRVRGASSRNRPHPVGFTTEPPDLPLPPRPSAPT